MGIATDAYVGIIVIEFPLISSYSNEKDLDIDRRLDNNEDFFECYFHFAILTERNIKRKKRTGNKLIRRARERIRLESKRDTIHSWTIETIFFSLEMRF